jgi:hypothetical protein
MDPILFDGAFSLIIHMLPLTTTAYSKMGTRGILTQGRPSMIFFNMSKKKIPYPGFQMDIRNLLPQCERDMDSPLLETGDSLSMDIDGFKHQVFQMNVNGTSPHQ